MCDRGSGDRVGTPESRSGKDACGGGMPGGGVGYREWAGVDVKSRPLLLPLVTPPGAALLPLAPRTFYEHFRHWCYKLGPALVSEVTYYSGPQAPVHTLHWAFRLRA